MSHQRRGGEHVNATTSAREPASRLSRIKGFGSRVCQDGERGSVGNAELAINMVQVDLHRTLGQP